MLLMIGVTYYSVRFRKYVNIGNSIYLINFQIPVSLWKKSSERIFFNFQSSESILGSSFTVWCTNTNPQKHWMVPQNSDTIIRVTSSAIDYDSPKPYGELSREVMTVFWCAGARVLLGGPRLGQWAGSRLRPRRAVNIMLVWNAISLTLSAVRRFLLNAATSHSRAHEWLRLCYAVVPNNMSP